LSLALAITVAIVAASGAYLALSRDLLRCVLGLAILGSAVNLLLFAAGRVESATPAIMRAGEATLGASANPLPQALVLTAIVIGFVLTCFSLVLVLRIVHTTKSDDLDALRDAEPVPTDPRSPPEEPGA
jgi:multicomponent Na+:H+ antiporter subunit C